MTTFKVEFSLSNLTLKVEGTREDIPLLTEQVSAQLTGLLKPAAAMAAAEAPSPALPSSVVVEAPAAKRRRRSSPGTTRAVEAAPDWNHDAARWGVAKQSWNVPDKLTWIMFVAGEMGIAPMSARQIHAVFNRKFGDAGKLEIKNMVRDLKRLRGASPALANENSDSSPKTWELTQAGKAKAQALIAGKNGASASS